MKPSIDFYLLAASDFAAGLPFVCRLVEKTYQQEHSSIIQLTSSQEAEQLDRLLWTFRPASFIPHWQSGPETLTVAKIQATAASSLVINCRLTATPEPLGAQRLLQIVPNQPNLLQLARQHYRFYQQQGCQLQTHPIK